MKRPREFDAHRYLRETRHRPPQRRSTDRDYRPVWIALTVAVAFFGVVIFLGASGAFE